MKTERAAGAVLKSGHPSSKSGGVLSADEVKTRLSERGLTLKAWAESKGYPYATVSQVLRGINRANFGMGHRIAVELGLKRG